MKWTNVAILFFLLELTLYIILDIRVLNLTAMINQRIEYNKALDSAVDDGTLELVEVDSQRNLVLNKEIAVEQFYQSLYANFGIMGNTAMEDRMKNYIPIILVTDEDGFYIHYSDYYPLEGENLVTRRWSEKYPYYYEISDYIINFTIDTYLTIYDKTTRQIYKGEYNELAYLLQDTLIRDEETFHIVRKKHIISSIEEKMNYYINKHNRLANAFGITYQFWLPEIDKTDWYRTIDDISMLVLLQGYPYSSANMGTYNRYAIGGARIKKGRVYYITEEHGRKIYHRSNCSHLNSVPSGIAYFTYEECALAGAYPCSEIHNLE